MSIGAQSMESEIGVDFVARRETSYECASGHITVLPFAIDADIPQVWQCRCGLEAHIQDGSEPEEKETKHIRTHWDMLLERRSMTELEDLFEERLSLLRSGELRRRSHAA
jgi:hypothetical protein